MESIIERIENGHFWQFHGGIHPPEMKFLTTDKPIRPLSMPDELIIPLQQHIGDAGELLVKQGDSVLKGQPLTKSVSPLCVPIHAPTSGTISTIEKATIAHPSGLSELAIKLIPDGHDTWRHRVVTENVNALTHQQIIEKIADAGISGMGGAGFPSHIKVSTSAQINYLIINAAECEPYITADDLLIREHGSTIVDGIKILDQLLDPAFILIGIEDNKPEAIAALKQATDSIDKIKICVLPTKYPTGGEKQLIKALTGKEVPSGVLPSSLGIVMQNIATCYAIADAVIFDTPLIKRVVTVSGQALSKPQNVWALLGTPVEFLLTQCGYPEQDKKHIIMGGPMMGFSLPSTKVPVVKTTNCILAPSEQEIPNDDKEVECIRCGQCADACPATLLPQELQWSAKAKDNEQLQKLNLFDCIECGACAYVCPSHIPLVHYYRIAKAEIREQKLLDIKAEKAKQRFEARKQRLERDKLAREAKHKKAAEARKARMNSGTAEAKQEKSAVAAALARVKAKKAQTGDTPEISQPSVGDKKSAVAAAVARAKAKKAQAAKESATTSAVDETKTEVNTEVSSDKSSKVAAAVAKAKAKKLAQSQTSQEEITVAPKTNADDDKKARIAAAVARAKAKKQNTSTDKNPEKEVAIVVEEAQETETQKPKIDAADDKKSKVAAAIAKAKAKKQAKENLADSEQAESQKTESSNVNTSAIDNIQPSNSNEIEAAPDVVKQTTSNDKKAKIAAAVAKAKAKKLAAAQSKNVENQSEQSE